MNVKVLMKLKKTLIVSRLTIVKMCRHVYYV